MSERTLAGRIERSNFSIAQEAVSAQLVLLVLASEWDQQTVGLVQALPLARLLTPADLSCSGWVYRSSRPEAATIVVGGEQLPNAEITGVFIRLPQVMPHELLHIVPADRGYVAAEMQAFLVAWLTALRCPVVNRPSPQCLAGPAFGRERWVYQAAALGIPVVSMIRESGNREPVLTPGEVITVVGETVLGAANEAMRLHARRLATSAGVTALAVTFQDGAFHSASLWIDIGDEAVVEALAAYFSSARKAHHDPSLGP